MQDALTRTGGEIVQMVEDVKYIVSWNKKNFENLWIQFQKDETKKRVGQADENSARTAENINILNDSEGVLTFYSRS